MAWFGTCQHKADPNHTSLLVLPHELTNAPYSWILPAMMAKQADRHGLPASHAWQGINEKSGID